MHNCNSDSWQKNKQKKNNKLVISVYPDILTKLFYY